jgi:hypothetical protein
MSEVDTWQAVSFWTENLTEILIRSLTKIEVPSVIRIETQGLKNKVVKNLTEVLIRSLTKIEVPSVIRIETQGLKNKVVKTQRPKVYLALIFKQYLSWISCYNFSTYYCQPLKFTTRQLVDMEEFFKSRRGKIYTNQITKARPC